MTVPIDPACVQRTIDIALASVKEGGRPFATVIADDKGNIIAEATNQVAQTHDPTAHAEVTFDTHSQFRLSLFCGVQFDFRLKPSGLHAGNWKRNI